MSGKNNKLNDDLPLARCPGPNWQDLLDRDSRPVPDFLRAESPYLNGMEDIPKERYLAVDTKTGDVWSAYSSLRGAAKPKLVRIQTAR